MILQYYKVSHGLCLNNFLQILLICNQKYQFPPFGYIIQDYDVSHLVRVRKVTGHMKSLMRLVNRGVEAVEICTDDNWDMKRVNLLYNMVSGSLNLKINKRFDSLSWSLVVRDFYTRRGYNIGELNE